MKVIVRLWLRFVADPAAVNDSDKRSSITSLLLLLLLSDYRDAVIVRVQPHGEAAVCIQSTIILHTSPAAGAPQRWQLLYDDDAYYMLTHRVNSAK